MDDDNRGRVWRCGRSCIVLGRRPLLMGILNATPDSFSGGVPNTRHAIEVGVALAQSGADIIDVGGESTRPGAEPVPVDVELERVVPVIKSLSARCDIPISIDTRRVKVAQAACEAGASIVNHVSSSLDLAPMLDFLKQTDVGYVSMHMKALPRRMQAEAEYVDVVAEVTTALLSVKRRLESAAIAADRVIYDPGIGFGKRLDHNLALMGALPELANRLKRPLLMGLSRKSWLGDLLGISLDHRDPFTAMASILLPFPSVAVHRVHNVEMVRKAFQLREALRQA